MRASWIIPTGVLFGVLLSAVAFATSRLEPPAEPFTSVAALHAVANYTSGLRKLDDDYAHRLAALRQQYVKEIDGARKAALEREDLDEAQRLLAEKKRVAAGTLQPGGGRGLVILSAVYGVDDQWRDISDQVRSKVTFSKFHYAPEEWRTLPDVAPGRHKSIIICYTLDGKVGVSITQDDQAAFDLPKR
jgi:hypothetical protein